MNIAARHIEGSNRPPRGADKAVVPAVRVAVLTGDRPLPVDARGLRGNTSWGIEGCERSPRVAQKRVKRFKRISCGGIVACDFPRIVNGNGRSIGTPLHLEGYEESLLFPNSILSKPLCRAHDGANYANGGHPAIPDL